VSFAPYLAIREAYAHRLPQWIELYEKTGEMRHDPYFMDWKFSPIENYVWGDIRAIGVPFLPQVPALNYFLDFANPFLKIGIECDGKAWHDHDLDKARDERLAADGWMIFRIEGHECNRVVVPWEDHEEEERWDLVRAYFMTTSEGVIHAIKTQYFDAAPDGPYQDLIDSTLFEHRSTPETNPFRRPPKPSGGPQRFSDRLDEIMETMIARRDQQLATAGKKGRKAPRQFNDD
jgi:hypothetical protein